MCRTGRRVAVEAGLRALMLDVDGVLVVDYPQVDDYRDGLAASYHSLAKVHRETGNPAE